MIEKIKQRLRTTDAHIRAHNPDPHILFVKRLLSRVAYGSAIDVGGSVGLYSSVFSLYYRHVLTIEANPALAAGLRRRLPHSCTVVEGAAGAAAGTLTMRVPVLSDGTGHYRGTVSTQNTFQGVHLKDTETFVVRTIMIDSLSTGKIGLLKIDVEGFEQEVLAGADAVLERDHPLILIEIDRRQNGAAVNVFDILEKKGYRVAVLLRDKVINLSRDQFERLQESLDDATLQLGFDPVNYLAHMPHHKIEEPAESVLMALI